MDKIKNKQQPRKVFELRLNESNGILHLVQQEEGRGLCDDAKKYSSRLPNEDILKEVYAYLGEDSSYLDRLIDENIAGVYCASVHNNLFFYSRSKDKELAMNICGNCMRELYGTDT